MGSKAKVRLFVGTRKGGYVVESNVERRKWTVHGPFQPGGDVFHVIADPREEGAVYASVNSPFLGPMLFRSADWGRKWKEIAPPMMTVRRDRPAPDFSGPPPAHPVTNLWHVEPGPENEPKTMFIGIDPASLFRSDDRGTSWTPLNGLNEHPTRPQWNPGAGGMCLHTILLDPSRPRRMYVGISAAGTFRSDDGGEHWTPMNHGVRVSFLPEKHPIVGQCVHKIALDPADPDTIYRQDHDGIYVSHDAMDSWKRIGRPLPHDFGFVVAAPRATPGVAYFVPLESQARVSPGGSLQVWRWTDATRRWTPTIKGHQFPGDVGTHREGLAADRLDPPGLYLGTTTGQVFYTRDGARSWGQVPYNFPAIHSVTVSSPAS